MNEQSIRFGCNRIIYTNKSANLIQRKLPVESESFSPAPPCTALYFLFEPRGIQTWFISTNYRPLFAFLHSLTSIVIHSFRFSYREVGWVYTLVRTLESVELSWPAARLPTSSLVYLSDITGPLKNGANCRVRNNYLFLCFDCGLFVFFCVIVSLIIHLQLFLFCFFFLFSFFNFFWLMLLATHCTTTGRQILVFGASFSSCCVFFCTNLL